MLGEHHVDLLAELRAGNRHVPRPGRNPSSRRRRSSSACAASRSPPDSGGASRKLTPKGADVLFRIAAIAPASASGATPVPAYIPRPPAAETAATSSGVVGPPAIGACTTGWRSPTILQLGLEPDYERISLKRITVTRSFSVTSRL